MATFKTTLADRKHEKLVITASEAWGMLKAGFKFSIVDPAQYEFRILRPYRVVYKADRATLLIEQQ